MFRVPPAPYPEYDMLALWSVLSGLHVGFQDNSAGWKARKTLKRGDSRLPMIRRQVGNRIVECVSSARSMLTKHRHWEMRGGSWHYAAAG